MNLNLKKEFEHYRDNQEELVKQYNGKYLVIIDKHIKGAYESYDLAYIEALKKFAAGSFLIQKCSPGDQDYTLTFYSNVVFSL
jgi:hypothetical protein